MTFDFVVIGATGEQGSIASRDLLEAGYRVLLCGRRPRTIKKFLKNKCARFATVDLRNIAATAKIIRASGSAIVLNCAELTWNCHAMESCLRANAHYLDLGGLHEMTKKQFAFDARFRRKKLTALIGCGSRPGIANVMVAYAVMDFDLVDHIDLGFAWDSNMKTFVLPYSFESIIHELTVPAIVLENGRFEEVQACSLEGMTSFLGVGRQSLYCIVHSEVFTFHRYFVSKGLKSVHYKAGFPLHSYTVIKTLLDLGFASKEPLCLSGSKIIPLDWTSDVLRRIPRSKQYKETEDIWAKIYGTSQGKPKRVEMDCLVKTTPGWGSAGSNVDTGRTAAVMAAMLHRGEITMTGVTAPEECVPSEIFFRELYKRGMRVYKNGKPIHI